LNNWIEIAEANLAANFRTLQAAAGPATEILAVIKANAYGHGAERCALILARAGARWLGVTNASEGVRVRHVLTASGFDPRILVMCGFFAEDVAALHQHRLTPVVWTLQQAAWLRDQPLPIHIEVDTGMNRQGIRPGSDLAQLLAFAAASSLPVEGVMTHFASSEETASPLNHSQRQVFHIALDQVRPSGIQPAFIHAGASSAVDNPVQPSGWLADFAQSHNARPMVRTGIALYGYTLPIDAPTPFAGAIRPALLPVLTWKTRILSVANLGIGDSVGYNAVFTATAPLRVALLPVGFADGLRRELSSTNHRPGGWVIIHGQRAPILGRISMNLTVVDVTHIRNTQPDDEVTVLGPGITADDHARLAETTAYEILCGIHPCG